MKKIRNSIRSWVLAFLTPFPFIGLFYLPRFLRDLFNFSRKDKSLRINLIDLQPCLVDWTAYTPFDPHYFYQGAWLARKVSAQKPSHHTDISSSVLTISVLSGFVETTFVDYRPLKSNLSGLKSIAGDILALAFDDKSIDSLSCLHVIEHIGLGRYGDPLDPNGSIKAALELQRVVADDGSLYLSVPVGRERICFNAHRVFYPETIISMFSELELIDFSYVDDSGQLHSETSFNEASDLDYGCGMFHFRKLQLI